MNNHSSVGTAPTNCFPQTSTSFRCCLWLAACLLLPFGLASAAQLKEARVSEIVKDVKLLPQQAPARPAVLSDQVKDGTAVRTGADSRAELTFTDQTLARLGANTIFSFKEGTRDLQLDGGAMLLRVPKDAGGAQISTAAITAAITGTTVMLEYHPNAYSKFIVLEGTGRIFRGDRVGESVLVNAGQMMIVNPASKSLPNPVDVDVKRLMKTSSLVKKFKPLASNKLIDHEIGTQTAMKAKGGLIETNLVIFGSGTAVTLLDPTTSGVVDQAVANDLRATPTPPQTPTPKPPPPITPTPTPSKTGKLSVIPSSTPYEINSGTTINTDPSITTNNQTDFGKMFRGPGRDGSLSTWLFGSHSGFDEQIGFDNLSDLNFAPLAAFKFSTLSLSGNPQIVISEGQPTSLALISVGDMISGFPGGALTFDGLNFLLLATQNGSITLNSNISFENIPNLAIYARGSDSDLKLDAPIFGVSNLALVAEHDINVTNSLEISQEGAAALTDGLNFLMTAGNDITIGNDLRLTIQNSDQVDKGGTISINAGGNLTVSGVAVLNLFNSNGGNIAEGGTISIQVPTGTFHADSDIVFRLHNEADQTPGGTIGGVDGFGGITGNVSTLSTDSSLDSAIFNQGGSFTSGASIDWSFGSVAVAGEASFRILNQDLGFGGGNIAGDALINIFSGTGFSAGTILVQINNLGGTIGGSSAINFESDSGALRANQNATFEILEDASNEAGSSIFVSANSISTGGSLIARIANTETSFDFENVSVNATDSITVGNQLLVDGTVAAGGDISATNGIAVAGDLTSDAGDITSTNGDITVGGNIAASGDPSLDGGPLVMSGRSITGQSILAGTLMASAGNVTIDNSAGTAAFGLMANTTEIGGNLFMKNSSSISPNGGSTDGTVGITPFDFNLTASGIISTGPIYPALFANGADASAASGNNNPGNGGIINLTLNNGLTIGAMNDLTSITANGGSFNSASTAGGNGGTINITSNGDVTLGGNVTATSGEFLGSEPGILGNGGAVNITTPGAITVNSKVEVSSASTTTPVRRSAKGGNVTLTSNKSTSGTAITIGNTGQLLALLDAAAPGPGGKITIVANGNGGSSVNVNGTVTASKGTVDIRHNGANGTVNVSDASGLNNALLSGDVVKVGALGTNGVLTVGRGTLSANDTLKLYGASADGEVRFVDNVTIGGQNFTIIAANTVTINNGKVVTVNGARADVYTGFNGIIPNANYTGFGGNNRTTGTFAGAGANNPKPISNAPPFDGSPGG